MSDPTELISIHDTPIPPTSLAERHAARRKVAAEAVDADDLVQLLQALGLDQRHEIADQLAGHQA